MRIIFMGTPDFAVHSLQALINSEYQVVAVVCQSDKPVGRKQVLTAPPVKQHAAKYGITVLQPEILRGNTDFHKKLEELNPELICVTAYGKILPVEILELPRFGCINVHASLLPKYRGAAPINWAIINGERITGITTMLMDKGMDTGDILLKSELEILDDDTSETLSDKLSEIGAELLLKTIRGYIDDSIKPVKQDENQATYAPMLKKETGLIDWTMAADSIRNLSRGLLPWPVAYTFLDKKILKIYSADIVKETGMPGHVIRSSKSELVIGTGSDSLSLKEVQLEGNRVMDIKSFLAGRSIKEKDRLG